MPDETPNADGGPHTESVELQLESKIPSRSRIAGLWHVLDLLKQIEKRIDRVNSMTVGPKGGLGGQVATQLSNATKAADAIEKQAAAVDKLTEAEGKLQKIRKTTFQKTKDVVTETTSKVGPGKTRTETRLNNTLEKTTETTDLAAIEKPRLEAEKALNEQRKKALEQRAKDEIAARESLNKQRQQAAQKSAEDEIKSGQSLDKQRQQSLSKRALDEANAIKGADKSLNDQRQKSMEQRAKDEVAANDLLNRQRSRALQASNEALNRQRNREMHRAAMRDMGGANFLSNLAKVTAWQASVGLLYGSLGLVRSGLQSLIETGAQTARLEQVFQGVGGSAGELADDVMRMAANEGRLRDEAMESAVQWSRLGLTRVQANEAVRVSLMAANVAEITAGDATERMSSLMAAYHLRVGQLAGSLGQLNAISNTYNVTNKDLLDGLARTSSVAQQAGLSFSQTIGIIAGAKGFTGQTGANIGNALKSMIGSLNDRNKQQSLRDKFRIELTTRGGNDVKDMGKALSDLFVAYQKMTDAERRHMLFDTFGKNQASRVAAMMDSYIKGQSLAIASQMNLNSAEKENIQIKAALRAQLQGLVTEWERFVNIQGNRGAGQVLGGMTQTLKNALRVTNTDVGSGVMTGMMALMGVLSARVALGALQMRSLAVSGGFVVNTFRAIRTAASGVVDVMQNIIRNFVASSSHAGVLRKSVAWIENGAVKFDAMAAGGARFGGVLRTAAFGARALAVSVAAIVEAALPLLLIWTGVSIFNTVMNRAAASAEDADRKLAGFNDRAEQAASAVSAAADAIKLMDTLQRALPKTRAEDRGKMIEDATSIAFFRPDGTPDRARNDALNAELQTLEKQGRTNEVIARLEDVKKQKWIDGMIARHRELEERQKSISMLRSEISMLEQKQRTKGLDKEENERLSSKQRELHEITGKRTQMLIEQNQGMEQDRADFLDKDLKHLAFLEKEKVLAQAISDIYAAMPQISHSDKLNSELAGEEAKLKHTQSMLSYLKDDPRIKAELEAERAKKELDTLKEYQNTKQELGSVDKTLGPYGGLSKVYDRLKAAASFDESLKENSDPMTYASGVASWMRGKSVDQFEKTDFMGKTGKELLALEEQRRALQTRLGELANIARTKMGSPSSVTDASYMRNAAGIAEMEKQEREQKARMEALERSRAAREQQDKNDVTMRFGKNQISMFGVGQDEAERIVNTEQGLKRLIESRKKLAEVAATAEERQRQTLLELQAINALEETRVAKLEMLVKLETERTNLIKEQQKEYAKSLLMAGPGDLLRKLAVKSLADKGGVNLGSFLALSKEGRQDYMDYTGGFKMRELYEQIARIRASGVPTSLQGMQDEAEKFRTQKRPLYGQAGMPAWDLNNPNSPILSASATAAAEVSRFGSVVNTVTNQLFTLVGRIQSQINRMSSSHTITAPSIWNPLDESVLGSRP